ncbi:MAG: fructose-1,6-bisphosphatase [Clostridiales bacterium]|nr:fructose-1,6-bisphosphatase [Clostridiales bacterium]
MRDLDYLRLLSAQYPTKNSALLEIIRLEAILQLPKGTELFLSDVHGEDEAFTHIINNASGIITEKIMKALPELEVAGRQALSSLIYYPEEHLLSIEESADPDLWVSTLRQLIAVSREVSSKYSGSFVRWAMQEDYRFIMEDLISYQDRENRLQYVSGILRAVITSGKAKGLVLALCALIKRLAVARLHLVGDIYDRGPHADIVMDSLIDYHSVDIQWGNHDILWMGAAAGSAACVASAVRNCIQYNNLDMLENSYGINLLPLALFANRIYAGDDAAAFAPRSLSEAFYLPDDPKLFARMHKAIAVIQFKLEGQLVSRRPEFAMQDRDVFSRVNWTNYEYLINGEPYPLMDTNFPSISPQQPLNLTDDEYALIGQLVDAFRRSEKLQKHVEFLYQAGDLYLRFNGNLLYHGCIPLEEDGSFMEFKFNDQLLSGRPLFEYLARMARMGFFAPENSSQRKLGRDYLWFLWCGRNAPTFGKSHIATFERLLICDEKTWIEKQNSYYDFYDQEEFVRKALDDFGCNRPWSRIINGHMPVKTKKGEDPRKAGGRLIVIDGGFCQAYQKKTGIAGFTMFFSSHGIRIAAHESFTSRAEAISGHLDIQSEKLMIENLPKRLLMADTDEGETIIRRVNDLEQLIQAYRLGQLSPGFIDITKSSSPYKY